MPRPKYWNRNEGAFKLRLDKLLTEYGYGTRSQVKDLIRKEKVTVSGRDKPGPETAVSEEDRVFVNGEELVRSEYEYWLLYKPSGYLTAVTDRLRPVVMDLIPSKRKDLSPVGRLDLDTEGVLLVTNDGMLSHQLLSPAKHVEKTYYAELASDLPENAAQLFASPMVFSDFTAKPALSFEKITDRSARLTICEGKFHQVRRMFLKAGCEVVYLRRERFSFLTLSGLKPGEARLLTEEEIKKLRSAVKE